MDILQTAPPPVFRKERIAAATITVTKSGSGACSAKFTDGTAVTLTAIPPDGKPLLDGANRRFLSSRFAPVLFAI